MISNTSQLRTRRGSAIPVAFAALVIAAVVLATVVAVADASPFSRRFRAPRGYQSAWNPHKYSTLRSSGTHDPRDPGQPLFVTQFLSSGNIQAAQDASQVDPHVGLSLSHAGYITVNADCGSNMFYWYFPAQNGNTSAPTLLWLQGGPGGSSMFGLLGENGPISVNPDTLQVEARAINWAQKFNLLYIDNPVGTGFSFTNKDSCYVTTEEEVADDLYEFLQQFFYMFPTLQNNEFYLTGESYAGKYVPAIGFKIHQMNQAPASTAHPDSAQPWATVRVPLTGMAIGDGWSDPETMVPEYPSLMYYFGLADHLQTLEIESQTDSIVYHILRGEFVEAEDLMDVLIDGDLSGYPSYFYNITGATDYYNILQTVEPLYYPNLDKFFAQEFIRKAIHVGSLPFNEGSKVETNLLSDIMKSVKPWVSVLLDNYKVMFYSGQLDLIVGAPLTEAFLRSVPWSGQMDYKRAQRYIWKVKMTDIEVAGFVRQVNNFTYALIRGAGHIAPNDQPERAYDMIYRFVNNIPFSDIVPPQ